MLKPDIKPKIKENGLKQNHIAKKLEMTDAQLSKLINNRPPKNVERLFELAKMLNCTVDELYKDETKK